MREDGGLDDREIDDLLARRLIKDVDATILRNMNGHAQNVYLEALVDEAQKSKEHPWL